CPGKADARERRRDVAKVALAAGGASVVTAALVGLLFQTTPGQREALEGVTMLLAAAVLFYVSYWLLSRLEVAKWNAFVKGRMEEALRTGSGFALASVAFLAVYRGGGEGDRRPAGGGHRDDDRGRVGAPPTRVRDLSHRAIARPAGRARVAPHRRRGLAAA